MQRLATEKDVFFDQLQLRQAELESSQSHLEVLQSQRTELEYQLRERDERLSLLAEELADANRCQDTRAHGFTPSAEEVAQLLSVAETRYEAKVSELRRKIATFETERAEVELEWNRKLAKEAKEVEQLKHFAESSFKVQGEKEHALSELQLEKVQLEEELQLYKSRSSQLNSQLEQLSEAEASVIGDMFLSPSNCECRMLQDRNSSS